MQRVGRKIARVAALVCVGMGIGGCGDLPTGPEPAGKSTIVGGQETSSGVMFPDAVWSVVQRQCVWCHTPQYPAANIDLTQRTQSLGNVHRMRDGVGRELAPFITRLSNADKQTILAWVQSQTGALPAMPIPSTFHWELGSVLATLPEGATVPGFGFVLEDAHIDNTPWKVATYRDRFGISAKSVALDQTHTIDQSVYSLSRNPSSYFVFKDIPWHGRFHDMRLEGDVRVDRWMSVGMQADEMKPTGRANRSYVRLQFDRDAICLRSAPTNFETWPWGGSAASPGADGKLSGATNKSGIYVRNDEWLHFVLTAARVAGGVRWTAVVTRRGDGATLASLQATQSSTTPLAGTFFLHAYAAGGKRNWANLVFDAQVDGGSTPMPAPIPVPSPRPRAAVVTASVATRPAR